MTMFMLRHINFGKPQNLSIPLFQINEKELKKTTFHYVKQTEEACQFYLNVGSFNFVTWQRKCMASMCVCNLSFCIHFCQSMWRKKRKKHLLHCEKYNTKTYI